MFKRLINEIHFELKRNPIKLLWMIIWFIPIHSLALLLSAFVGISSLSFSEATGFYHRLIK